MPADARAAARVPIPRMRARASAKIIPMLNADDQFTPASLYRLREAVRQKRPFVIWVGAGASQWAGLPSWKDSARRMRRDFAKSVPSFQDGLAKSYITSQAYPDLFQICRDADKALYNRTLINQFSSPTCGPVYGQLIEGLKKIAPLQIVTTNVDLCLEQHLGPIDVIERTDLGRCGDSILSGTPFIAKLHGSISSIASTIFTNSDYQSVVKSPEFMAAVKSLFSMATVVFLGYGMKDDYVLNLIAENEAEHHLFGNGPHFRVTSSPGPQENGVYSIGYKTAQHQDHRAALTVLNEIEQQRNPVIFEAVSAPKAVAQSRRESGFYISYFRPSGAPYTGQAFEAVDTEGTLKINALIGLGFAEGEFPDNETVAFHDLAVGLTCFDRVFLPLNALNILHDRATPEVFWVLMDTGAIRFVDVVHQPLYVSVTESLFGDVGVTVIRDQTQTEERSTMSEIRRILRPVPGREEEGNKRIDGLASKVERFSDSAALNLGQMVRDALLLPRVSMLLGYSDYAVSNRIPRWLAYPTLRFAHLVETGLICNQLDIRASRVPFGGVSLLSAAFNIKPADQTVFEYASFVMAGAFGSNLSTFIEGNPKELLGLIKFRESAEGEALRREVSDRLDANGGTEFSTAIEGSLQRAIPTAVLQAARNKFSTLIKAESRAASADALWADKTTSDSSLWLWRARSRELLLGEAKTRGVRSDSPCLCGSGDRFADCCLRPLR